jgi:large subunit ribosomal protein L9
MKVILKEDVKALGKKGKVCEVSDGYARNFLIPKGMAIEATNGNIQDLAHKQKQEDLRKKKEKDEAEALKNKLESLQVLLKVKVGDKGKLFGSVTNKEVADVLGQAYGIKLDKRKIEVKEPIKALGNYIVTAKLHPDVSAELKISVEGA